MPPISLCACMCIPSIVPRQRLGKYVPWLTNTHAIMEQSLDAMVHVRSVFILLALLATARQTRYRGNE
jgi:hypothetical protein